MKWYPIETAPKDGTEFFAYDPVSKKFDVCEMSNLWGLGWQCRTVQMDGEYGPLSDEFNGRRATLWSPLPTEEPRAD